MEGNVTTEKRAEWQDLRMSPDGFEGGGRKPWASRTSERQSTKTKTKKTGFSSRTSERSTALYLPLTHTLVRLLTSRTVRMRVVLV